MPRTSRAALVLFLASVAVARAGEPSRTERFLGPDRAGCRLEWAEATLEPGWLVHLDGSGSGAIERVAMRGFHRSPDLFVTRRRLAIGATDARALFSLAVEADVCAIDTSAHMGTLESIPPRLVLENARGERVIVNVRDVAEAHRPRLDPVIAAVRDLTRRDGGALGPEVRYHPAWRPWPSAIVRWWWPNEERSLRGAGEVERVSRLVEARPADALEKRPSRGPGRGGEVIWIPSVELWLTRPSGEALTVGRRESWFDVDDGDRLWSFPAMGPLGELLAR